jgi:hypothetical protein
LGARGVVFDMLFTMKLLGGRPQKAQKKPFRAIIYSFFIEK